MKKKYTSEIHNNIFKIESNQYIWLLAWKKVFESWYWLNGLVYISEINKNIPIFYTKNIRNENTNFGFEDISIKNKNNKKELFQDLYTYHLVTGGEKKMALSRIFHYILKLLI